MRSNAVIIPFYKPSLTTIEAIALQQCFKVLHKHPVIAIAPNKLDLSFVSEQYAFSDVIRFDDDFFNDIYGYNQLMISPLFYQSFASFSFILIYQPDAFVFEDKLDYWCSQGYDYIGAPWLDERIHHNIFVQLKKSIKKSIHTKYNFKRSGFPSRHQFINTVGNGGFSLRRVNKFYELSIAFKDAANAYIDHRNSSYNEDRFWSVEVNRKKRLLNIPDYKTALHFSFETFPENAYELTGHTLPFGCHAWDEFTDFWRPFFKEQGYKI